MVYIKERVQMSNGTYYAVSGADAFGVYTNISWAKNIADYIRNPRIVKCNTLQQAFCIARDDYNDYQLGGSVDAVFYGDSLDVKLNKVLFKSQIIKQNISN